MWLWENPSLCAPTIAYQKMLKRKVRAAKDTTVANGDRGQP